MRTYLNGGTLCERGHAYARDVAQYIYSKGGKAYSVIDRAANDARVQIEIPPECYVIRDLLKAVDKGLKVRTQTLRPALGHDRTYPVRERREMTEAKSEDRRREIFPRRASWYAEDEEY